MKSILNLYFRIPLISRILTGFVLGVLLGLIASQSANDSLAHLADTLEPFGAVLISMLKMVVFPIIFFSLIAGSAALPLKKSGRLGASVLLWYLCTSIFATIFGITMAFIMNPKLDASALAGETAASAMVPAGSAAAGLAGFLSNLFLNPFEALSQGKFLAIIVFAILFGLAARTLLDSSKTESKVKEAIETLLRVIDALQSVAFKLIDWVMEYFPFGVFVLTFVNFTRGGAQLFGPYLRIMLCVICGLLMMILVIYPLFLAIFCRENPYRVLFRLRRPVIVGFVTRSSSATLPITIQTMNNAGVSPALTGFSLPLGSTINMDGVCVHLPVFVILAANIFGVPLTLGKLVTLVVTVVFSSIGAGGIPSGCIFLLFMILENAGFTPAQTASIVALAFGINPILDMFETSCNITGDMVCTYVVAKNHDMITPAQGGDPAPESGE